jgi:predicted Rossmann-fold nucleotide-binding protein
MDLIIYTGAGYSGRDILLTRSSDAVVIGCGRVGTIHEFTVAFEDNKPIGILRGPWETDKVIQDIMDKGDRHSDKVIFDEDPKKLIERIITMIKETKVTEYKVKGVNPDYANTCIDPTHDHATK